MPKKLTKDEISEFKKIKEWVSECPIEATMRIQELERNLEHGAKVAVKTAEKLYYEQQKSERYREALEFYANEDNHEGFHNEGVDFEPKIFWDNGYLARKALEGE